MKFSLGLLSLVIAGSSFAAPNGPWLSKTVGNPTVDKSYVDCLVVPGTTTIQHVAGGKLLAPQTTPNTVSPKVLAVKISLAAKAPIVRALHTRETVPNLHLRAGLFPQIPGFTLVHDASQVDYRDSAESQDLVFMLNVLCGKLKPAGESREE